MEGLGAGNWTQITQLVVKGFISEKQKHHKPKGKIAKAEQKSKKSLKPKPQITSVGQAVGQWKNTPFLKGLVYLGSPLICDLEGG